VITLYNYPVSY